jgi:hypothetical protein
MAASCATQHGEQSFEKRREAMGRWGSDRVKHEAASRLAANLRNAGPYCCDLTDSNRDL